MLVVLKARRLGRLIQRNNMLDPVGPLKAFGELLNSLNRGWTDVIVRHVKSPGS